MDSSIMLHSQNIKRQIYELQKQINLSEISISRFVETIIT